MCAEFVQGVRGQICDVEVVLWRRDVSEEGAVEVEFGVVEVGVGGIEPGEVKP